MRKIILFTVPGCAACEEFKPRFTKVMTSNSIPHEIVDLTKSTPEFKQIAKAFDVYAFPTTIILNEDKGQMVEGNVSEDYLRAAIKKCFE